MRTRRYSSSPNAKGAVQACTGCTLARAHAVAMSGCLTTGSEADPQTAAKGHSCFCELSAATPASDSQARLHTHSLPCKSSRGVRQCGMWQACPQSRGSRHSGWRLRRQRRRWLDTGGQGARTGADGGHTGGGGQGGLACCRVRSWQARAAAGTWQLVVVAVAVTVVAATGAETAMVVAVAAAERQRRPRSGRDASSAVAALHLSGPPGWGRRGNARRQETGEIFFPSSWFCFTNASLDESSLNLPFVLSNSH